MEQSQNTILSHSNDAIKNNFFKIVSILLSSFLLFFAFYVYIYRDVVELKIGMSHFFEPQFVGILTYLLIILGIFGGLGVIFWGNRWSIIPAFLILLFYLIYNISLLVSTGSNCGCANIFIDIDLRIQIASCAIFLILSLIFLLKKRIQINK